MIKQVIHDKEHNTLTMEIFTDVGGLILHHTVCMDSMRPCQIKDTVTQARDADPNEFYLSAVTAHATMYAQAQSEPVWQ